MNNTEHHISSELFIPLNDGPRKVALAVLAPQPAAIKDAEHLVFEPKRLIIERIEPKRKGLRTVYTLHLVGGMKLHFDPSRPGLFVLKKDKMYVRALRVRNVHFADSVHLLCEPRFRAFHKQLKWLIPIMAALGVHPHRFAKVFKLEHQVFKQYYDTPEPV